MAASDHLSPVQFSFDDYPKSGGVVGAMSGEDEHGYLDWTNNPHGAQINSVWVHPDHRRQGLATQMLAHAKAHGVDPKHNEQRTESGDAWARSTGATSPSTRVAWDNSLYPEA